ncbi:MAG: TrkA family potassium uptake protein [Cellulomonadaceae bacterium]|jgi:trk system potassium uptake protein TrkA|nr:TrkA family potassium uptake protein [Cellulomonadaceae bacterium]
MHFVIVGCGRVGASLATQIEGRGHSVAVIDQNPEAFRRLPADFEGQKVKGIGFDRDTLRTAGIEDAYALAAVTDGDNSNVVAARVAREVFGLTNVVARIYDARRAEVYQRLGIPTVATVRWTADQMLRRMLPLEATSEYRDPSGQVRLAQVNFAPGWVGATVASIEAATGVRVAFFSRYSDALLPAADTVLQEGDVLYVLMRADDADLVERMLAKAPSAAVKGAGQ